MVSDSDGLGFDHFRGSSLVESHRWCSGVDLDHRLVRRDNGCSGDHFWLSLAQLADTGNPLIRGKTSSVLPSEDSGPFCVSWERHRPVRKLFVRLSPMARTALRADELAVESIEKHLELNPDEARAYSLSGSVLIRLGETERSKQWTEQALTLAPKDPLILYNAACNWALLGEHERAFDGLERALEAGAAVGDWLRYDPDFESLRSHARFQTILKRIAPS
jgi:tetratricopeptide (TPR) repeat protein